MEWFEKSPGALRLAFAFGVGLTSAFAATVIPGWGQFTLFAIGAVLMSGSLLWAGYLFFYRHTRNAGSKQPTGFIPIWQAVQRVALINGEAKDTNFFPKARGIVRQAALDGEIILRGRKQIGSVESVQTVFDSAFVDIPRAYWEEFEIGPYAAVENEHVNNPYTRQLERKLGPLSHYYAELQAPRVQSENLWQLPEGSNVLLSVLTAKRATLEMQVKAARAQLKEKMHERDKAEATLHDSPSPKTSDAYKHANDRVGEAIRQHDAARDELIKLNGVIPKEPTYMTAYEALHYMVDQSEWGAQVRALRVDNNINPQFPMRKQPLFEAMVEFRAAAEAGHVAAFGRKNGIGDLVEIPSFYWASASLSSFCMYNPTISETMPSDPNPDGISSYKNVRIVREDVYIAWPRPLPEEE